MFWECSYVCDYLNAGELEALTAAEMCGWNAAIEAADAAEYDTFRLNRNSFGDLADF